MFDKLCSIASKGVESIGEASKETAFRDVRETSPIQNSMEIIENTSLESLQADNAAKLSETDEIEQVETEESEINESEGLTEEEKQKIKNETGWSDEIIDAINSVKEYDVYKNAGLQEVEVNGKKCLVRSDIDWDQKDSNGCTNKERASKGISPIHKDGETIELHHIGQKSDSPFAELTQEEHRGKENYSILHDTKKESEIDRDAFTNERGDHWRTRVDGGVQHA